MKKVELLDNETFTIKGVYGETYVFDGDMLFVDSSNVARKAVVLKSLRTREGAESWLRTAGRSFTNAQVVDTASLKSFEGRVVTRKSLSAEDESKEEDFEADLPFHVVSTEGDEDGEGSDDGDMDGDMGELMEDEEQEQEMSMTQIAQILHDAEKLYSMIEQDEHLEPWMQSKLAKISELIGAIAENLEHEDGDVPEDGEGDSGMTRAKGKKEVDDALEDASLPALPSGITGEDTDVKKMLGNIVKSVIEQLVLKSEGEQEETEAPADEGEEAEEGSPSDEGEGGNEGVDEGQTKSVTGRVFKSLNAARQWNRFENPDKDRYYIDIMREKDVRKSFSKSSGLNAKYVVRDKWDEEEPVMKGAHGNKIVKGKVIPEKNIDSATRRVAAIRKG